MRLAQTTTLYRWNIDGLLGKTAFGATIEKAAEQGGVNKTRLSNKVYHDELIEIPDYLILTTEGNYGIIGSADEAKTYAKKLGDIVIEIQDKNMDIVR